MMTIDEETFGYYEPGFLHLRVNTDRDIYDLNKLSKEEGGHRYFSTFLHEYIHFLQDVTTTSGLLSAVFYIDLIKEFNGTVLNETKSEFKVPMNLSNANNVLANYKLREIYKGESKVSNYIRYDRFTVEETSILDKEGQEFKPKKYKVFYYDLQSKELENFYFGSTCLKEYVAHAIQKKYYPEVEHPDIPYLIAEEIVYTECPDFGKDQMLIVTLCDACLMSYYPAQMFFETISRMKKERYKPNNSRDVYDFTLNEVSFEGEDGAETVESLFVKNTELASNQFLDALKSKPFKANYKWLLHIITEAKKIRLSHRNFMSELVLKEGVLSPFFYELFNSLGTPFFTNNKGKGGIVIPSDLKSSDIQPYQLLVFKQMINVYSGLEKCSLYDFCKTRPDKDITNELCQTAPWERIKELELCPFAQLWQTWGLAGKTPVK
jgi:hypothetical protein